MSNQFKDFLSGLRAQKLTEFGAVILGNDVRKTLEIEYPSYEELKGMDSYDIKRTFDKIGLAEMSAIDYVRNVLLNEGKYIRVEKGNYRILLPSENTEQIESYISSADKKLSRALKLSRNTPQRGGEKSEQLEARIMLKRQSHRHRSK